MFSFVIKRLYFLCNFPFASAFFDCLLKIYCVFINHKLIDIQDEIEKEVNDWPDIESKMHKFGGVEFILHGNEIGHIHSNGLLDILFTKEIKHKLLFDGQISNHHRFPKSGWISFYIKSEKDKGVALSLLRYSYQQSLLL